MLNCSNVKLFLAVVGSLVLGAAFAGPLEWTLELEPADGKGKSFTVESVGQAFVEEKTEGVRRFRYPELTANGKKLKIALKVDIRETKGGCSFCGELVNGEREMMVTRFTGPWRTGVAADPAKSMHYVPKGLGRCKRGLATFETPMYPGVDMSLPFVMVDTGVDGTVYAAVHDPLARPKRAHVRWNAKTRLVDFAFSHFFTLPSGQTWKLPESVFEKVSDWHAGARRYRAWFDGVHDVRASAPDWTRDLTGWVLAIMRQQNEELIWSYRDIPLLCDIAERRGLNMLGLFGWTKGGHDHLYPDYDPDPAMGGREGLKAGIAEAQRRGLRVCLYANGQLQQVGATEFWKQHGERLALRNRDGSLVLQHYHKYRNIPKYDFALGCLAGREWHDQMLKMAQQAAGLGADALLYDQLGVYPPFHCFGKGHGHVVPSWTYAEERPAFTRSIVDTVRRQHPQFTLSTEGFHDSILDSMGFFHGLGPGFFANAPAEVRRRTRGDLSGAFPELVRYTFPEYVTTLRRPTPMVRPEMAAYAAVFGCRQEIELRYQDDRTYILEGKVGKYDQVVSGPNVRDMREIPADKAAADLKRVADFQHRNAKYLLRGRFVDDEGFTCTPKNELVAKRFIAEDGTSAVCVWNISERPQEVVLAGLGAVVAVDAPTGECAEEPLSPNGLRLYVFGNKVQKD